MLYPQYFIDDLKNRADLVRIIQPYAADLKKKGANWMACCPFHQEKTPSFSVNPAKGFYKCFGCGKGGTAFNFVMEMEGLNFPEAVKRVAEMSGVQLPEPVDDQKFERSKKQREEKKQLADQVIELNQVALEFWEKELETGKSEKVKKAREYLAERGISEEIQKKFRIGFSPDSWDGLINVLRDFGADDKLIAQSGLVSVNEEKDRTYDRFRGRIMFPVLDVNGRPVAFGARGMTPEDTPKYLNSPETPAYIKGEHLYGLFQGKDEIRKKKFAILVEGYLDLIALAQFGVTNVAASLGTAFTPEQAKLLNRFAERVVINYDGDSAGIKAARRAIEQLLPQDFDVKVLVLPDGKDPDDFIRENGTEAYNAARGKAEPYLDFVLNQTVKGRNLRNARHVDQAVKEILPLLSTIPNRLQISKTLDRVLDYLGVFDATVRKDLLAEVLANKPKANETSISLPIATSRPDKSSAEWKLIHLIFHSEEIRIPVVSKLEPTDYENLLVGGIYDAVVQLINKSQPIDVAGLLDYIGDDETLVNIAHELITEELESSTNGNERPLLREAEGCVLRLREQAVVSEIREIQRLAVLASDRGDDVLFNQLTFEQLELEKIRRSLQPNVAFM